MRLKTKAPAKINLYLDITGKRPDGYHNIRSIMQSIDLCDTVSVELCEATRGESSISLTCSDSDLPCDETNLACKAALAFFRGISAKYFSCRIHIEKIIPMAAGLAGGSSDAAAVLKLLNRLHSSPLDTDALCDLGATVGADVPFCIRGGTLVAEGIGERLRSTYSFPKSYIAVAVGGRGVSTPDAYRMLDYSFSDDFGRDPAQFDAIITAIREKNISAAAESMYNIFEKAVLPRHRTARQLKEIMSGCGALGTLMSGSGPSVFGIFDTREKAEIAARTAATIAEKAFACSTEVGREAGML